MSGTVRGLLNGAARLSDRPFPEPPDRGWPRPVEPPARPEPDPGRELPWPPERQDFPVPGWRDIPPAPSGPEPPEPW